MGQVVDMMLSGDSRWFTRAAGNGEDIETLVVNFMRARGQASGTAYCRIPGSSKLVKYVVRSGVAYHVNRMECGEPEAAFVRLPSGGMSSQGAGTDGANGFREVRGEGSD